MTDSAYLNDWDVLLKWFVTCLMSIFCIYFGSKLSLSDYITIKEKKITDVVICSNKAAMIIPIFQCVHQSLITSALPREPSTSIIVDIMSYIIIISSVMLLKSQVNSLLNNFGFQSEKRQIDVRMLVGLDRAPGDSTETEPTVISYRWTDVVGVCVAGAVGIWYLATYNWVANNILGMAISIWAVRKIYMNKLVTSSILLSGFMVYDVIGVFGTNIMQKMLTMTKSPILLYFPRDFLTAGFSSTNIGFLGIADVIIPGIFLSFLMRFDQSCKGRRRGHYFKTGCIAYTLGLALCSLAIRTYGGLQPALLYLNPVCLIIPIIYSVILKEFQLLWEYEDFPSEEKANSD